MATAPEIRRANLRALLTQYASNREFADAVGQAASYISQIKSGHRNIGDDVAREMERKLELPRGYFDVPHSEESKKHVEVSPVAKAPAPGPRSVPIISWVEAGHPEEAVDLYEPGDGDGWTTPHKACSPHTFALRVQGDSMVSPNGGRSYPPGTIIIVDPEVAADSQKRVVARNANGETTFKELVRDAGRFYLKPLNPQYETLRINGDWHIIGVVIGSYMPE